VATLDKDMLRAALEKAVVVIDADEFDRSRHDPRVRTLFQGGEKLLTELEAEGANR
jgi:hypothetical protein